MTHLLGRARECAALDGALGSVRAGMSAVLVLRGEPGVGKSSLLDYAEQAARDLTCIRLAGVESESQVAYASLHRLSLPYLDRLERLPLPQRQVLESAFGLADDPPANTLLLGLAMLSLLAGGAQRQPLLCLIDDAQWLDADSSAVLAFVARRLHAEHIGIFFAVREPPHVPLFDGIEELAVTSLDGAAATELVIAAAEGHADQQVAASVAEQAEGNPLALIEVGKELAAGRSAPALLLRQPLPMGNRLEEHFRQQVRELPASSRTLLLLIAADSGTDPATVWRAAEIERLPSTAASPAEARRLVELTPQLRFRHPLIRSAVYYGASAAQRRHAHGVLARAIDADTDPQQQAWHRAAASRGPDEQVAAELARDAQAARQRGGFLAAADLLARAAELSPDGARAVSRRLEAAEAALTGGAPLRAISLLEGESGSLPSPVTSAQVARIHARALATLGRGWADEPGKLLDAAVACAPMDGALARQLMLEAVVAVFIAGSELSGTTSIEIGRVSLGLLGDPDSAELRGPDLLLAGLATLITVGYVEAAPRLRRALTALAEESALDDGVPVWFLGVTFAATVLWEDRAGIEWLERCEETARQTGALEPLILALLSLSFSCAQRGLLAEAETRTEEGRQLGRALGWNDPQIRGFFELWTLAYRGDIEPALRGVDELQAAAKAMDCGSLGRMAYSALIRLRVGLGQYSEAFDAAAQMRVQDTIRITGEALPELVEAGSRGSHAAEAATALVELEAWANASGTPWALGLLARSSALLANDDGAEPLYLDAIRLLGSTTVPVELARTRLLYGEWLRRQNRPADARDELRLAYSDFRAMGATALAERARRGLAAAGEQVEWEVPAEPRLTAQEAQIARLAAGGSADQEIASRLFLSVSTVEYHLKEVFGKLDITSRRKLQDALNA